MKYCLFISLIFSAITAYTQDSLKHKISKPFFTSKEISVVNAGDNYNYQFEAIDSNDRKIEFTAEKLPDWLKLDTAAHTLTGINNKSGQYPVRLIADNGVKTDTQFYMLTVKDKETANILCLGNSITNGTDRFNSYRRDLWQLVHSDNYNFDFVGSWNKHHLGGSVPDPDFDTDHEGHSGWTFAHMFKAPGWDSLRGNIFQWLGNYTPDIVLMELGTNDIFQCRSLPDIKADFERIIDMLRKSNPNVKILVGAVLPMGKKWAPKKLCPGAPAYKDVITLLNKNYKLWISSLNAQDSPVRFVDQFTAVNPAIDMYDDIHPNAKGEKIMAQRWFDSLKGYLKKLP